jgi:hypothetical protein
MVMKTLLDGPTERETQFVEPEAYFHLLTSRRRLERADDETQGLLGLVDLESQVRFVVPAREVWKQREGAYY